MYPQNPQQPQAPRQQPPQQPQPQTGPTLPTPETPSRPAQYTPPQQPQPMAYGQQDAMGYLNEISTAQPEKKKFGLLPFILLAGLIVSILLASIMMIQSTSSTDKSTLQAIYLRMGNIEKITKEYNKKLRSSNLRKTNTNLQIFIVDSLGDVKTSFTAAGALGGKEGIPASISSKEAKHIEELKETFYEAQLNLNLDRAYARAMSFEVTYLRTLMRKAYKTASPAIKTALESSDENLAEIIKDFDNYSETSKNISQPRDGS